MKRRSRTVLATVAGSLLMWPTIAQAQLWNPHATVPTPNEILGLDTSVTMGQTGGCGGGGGGCHTGGPLSIAKSSLTAAIPLFEDYLNYGFYEYYGCTSAQAAGGVAPSGGSLPAVTAAINGATFCREKEEFPPGGSRGTCLTPGCNDLPVLMALIQSGGLPGFDALSLVRHSGCGAPSPNSPCPPGMCDDDDEDSDADDYPRYGTRVRQDPGDIHGWYRRGWSCELREWWQFLVPHLATLSWPRWARSNVDAALVEQQFCQPLRQAAAAAENDVVAYTTGPANCGSDIVGIGWSGPLTCNPAQIAAAICTTSPLANTCLCDQSNRGCVSGAGTSACGVAYDWKARQQVGVCHATSGFMSSFQAQPDNVVNGGGCRENGSLFVTDGYMGGTNGVAGETGPALLAGAAPFRSASGRSNMLVAEVTGNFSGDATAMARTLAGPMVIPSDGPYNGASPVDIQIALARQINGMYQGVYSGSPMAFDTYQTRIAYHVTTVPGFNDAAGLDENYLGWPSRISWYRIDPSTRAQTLLFDTDEQTRVSSPAPSCGFQNPPGGLPNGQANTFLGPNGNFRNGVPRDRQIGANTLDRDGDGSPDQHKAVRYGSMFGRGVTRPVIVEAPRNPTGGLRGVELAAFQTAWRDRPRAIYTFGNGYLHGFHGGSFVDTPGTFGKQNLNFKYDDEDPNTDAGHAILRYAPSWVALSRPRVRYDFQTNHLFQAPLTEGQLAVKDVWITALGGWRTMLVGAQGKSGPGYLSIDVTDPCAVGDPKEWTLPAGDVASAEPTIYTFPMPPPQPNAAAEPRAVVITTGGAGGSPNLYAYDLADGALLASGALPAGGSYPSAPVCLDLYGDGHVTNCYVVRDDGLLVRAQIIPGGFGSVDDITPATVRGGGRVFSTRPAAFFNRDGSLSLVFGSGDYRNLETFGPANFVYKVVDRSNRKFTRTAAPADLATACTSGGTNGTFGLGNGERLISPPSIEKGIVSWATFRPGTVNCINGTATLYTMNYETCQDAASTNARPQPIAAGSGLPTTPLLHRQFQTVMVGTSATPTPPQATNVPVSSRGAQNIALKRAYWRLNLDQR